MQLVVRAFPVLPGREEEMREFAREVKTTRSAEVMDFYRRMGVARETWHVQETPQGLWVIGVTQLDEKPVEVAAAEYAGSHNPFDVWFKDQITHLTGIDPATEPLGPPTECIFDTAEQQGASQMAAHVD